MTTERQHRALAFSFVALAAGWAVLASPWLSGRVVIPYDAKAHFLPQLQFLADSWSRGESAAWAPYVFSGHPQIADPQSLMFSPPFALLAWFNPAPTAWAADATLFLTILAGAAAMLVWLNDKGWHPAAAALSALSFAFGAAMAWRVQHVGQVLSLSYLPIVLVFLDRALDRRSIAYGAAAGLSAAFLVLGRDQVALLCIYLLIAHVVVRLVRERTALASAAPLAAASVTGAAVIAIPILLTVLAAAESNRPQIGFDGAGRGSLHPALLLSLFSADAFSASGSAGDYWGPPSPHWKDTGLYIAQNMGQLYLGALPALALVWGAASGALWRSDIRFYSIALAVAVVYGLGWYTPVFRALHALVPGVDLFRRPADAAFLIGFLASIAAGYALNVWLFDQRARAAYRPLIATVAVVTSVFFTLAALAVHFDVLERAWPVLAMSAALFAIAGAVAFGAKETAAASPALATLLVAAALTSDLAWSNRPGGATGLPGQVYSVLDPSSDNDTIARVTARLAATASDVRRDRTELVGFGFHWPNAALTHRFESTLGYNPLRIGAYADATGAGDHAGLASQRQFSPLFPGYRSRLANMLGISTIATSVPIEEIDRSLMPGDVTLIARTRDGYVYDNPGAFPRVAFATSAAPADLDALIAFGAWPDVDYSTTVLLDAAGKETASRRPGIVKLIAYANDRVRIDVDSPDGGWVVLYDIWQPWWFAEVDGKPAALLRANGLFRAVAAPPGRHTIAITFEPVRGALRQLFGSGPPR